MQFDITGFAIFLAFILPGVVAQKSRDSLVPRSLKPLSAASEVGEFVLAGVWVHVFLVVVIRLFFFFLGTEYFRHLATNFEYDTFARFLWSYRRLAFVYFVASLAFGYLLGFLQGVLILRQPLRKWATSRSIPTKVLRKLGVTGFLEEQPIWYFVLKQTKGLRAIFVQVEMKNAAGFYTGQLISYGILDDSIKSKDFYLEKVFFKQTISEQYAPVRCDGLLLNFEDVVSIQITRVETTTEGQPSTG
jgi:Family of unknown function (DUF6338)